MREALPFFLCAAQGSRCPPCGPFLLAALHNPFHDALVPDAPFDRAEPIAQELLELTARTTARAEEDPFGNPVLLVSLEISRRIQSGALDDDTLASVIRYLRD